MATSALSVVVTNMEAAPTAVVGTAEAVAIMASAGVRTAVVDLTVVIMAVVMAVITYIVEMAVSLVGMEVLVMYNIAVAPLLLQSIFFFCFAFSTLFCCLFFL